MEVIFVWMFCIGVTTVTVVDLDLDKKDEPAQEKTIHRPEVGGKN